MQCNSELKLEISGKFITRKDIHSWQTWGKKIVFSCRKRAFSCAHSLAECSTWMYSRRNDVSRWRQRACKAFAKVEADKSIATAWMATSISSATRSYYATIRDTHYYATCQGFIYWDFTIQFVLIRFHPSILRN